jgi:hypothetical protein
MWVGATAKLWTLVAVGTLVTGLSARGQQASTSNGGDSAPGNLQIVGLTQIDQNGAAVPDDTLHLRIPLAIPRQPARRCRSPWLARLPEPMPRWVPTCRTAQSWRSTSTTPPTPAVRFS